MTPAKQTSAELRLALNATAKEIGFSSLGICAPKSIPLAPERLSEFLSANHHGEMNWMGERVEWRSKPHALWPQAQSVIMLTDNYGPTYDPLTQLEKKDCGAISVYAQNKDYHEVIKKRLKRLGRWLIAQAPDTEIKVFVDTAPIMEKPLAQSAGLGWQGKHTNLVSRELGSWFFLAAIFTTYNFKPDPVEDNHCGNCQSCLDICPTDAFTKPYQLDARKCISYLTIEYSGKIDPVLRPKLGNRIYGCDDCLAICPWNKFATTAHEAAYIARQELISPDLSELLKLDDPTFRKLFSKSPVKRIGRNRFIRNILYAIGNSGNCKFLDEINPFLRDPNPVIKDAASWALEQLKASHE